MNTYLQQLKVLEEANNLRKLDLYDQNEGACVSIGSKTMLNFSSNDYLGVSQSTDIKQTVIEQWTSLSMGSTGSRLLGGDYELIHRLEKEIADWMQKESALVFNSGYQANVGVLSSLLCKNDVVFADKAVHASIIDGIKLSEAKLIRYKHKDHKHLKQLLEKHRVFYEEAFIVTESLFSMDGDTEDIVSLCHLKTEFRCYLMVDEAHSIGCFGEEGQGISFAQNQHKNVDIIVATFGKAFGSYGAFVATNEIFKQFLINKARSFIYSTALPIPVILWNLEAIKRLKKMNEERSRLLLNTQYFRQLLMGLGFQLIEGAYIVPIIIGENKKVLKISSELKNNNFLVKAVRPPTVPIGRSRLRVSLSLLHTKENLLDFSNKLKTIYDNTI